MYRCQKEEDFKQVLFSWVKTFCRYYLNLNPSTLQKSLFIIRWPDNMDSLLDPDIGGAMAESIAKASDRLNC